MVEELPRRSYKKRQGMRKIAEKSLPLHSGRGFLTAYGLQSTPPRDYAPTVNPHKG